MADSKGIQEIVNKAAVQASPALMRMFSDAEIGLQPAIMQNQQETER